MSVPFSPQRVDCQEKESRCVTGSDHQHRRWDSGWTNTLLPRGDASVFTPFCGFIGRSSCSNRTPTSAQSSGGFSDGPLINRYQLVNCGEVENTLSTLTLWLFCNTVAVIRCLQPRIVLFPPLEFIFESDPPVRTSLPPILAVFSQGGGPNQE